MYTAYVLLFINKSPDEAKKNISTYFPLWCISSNIITTWTSSANVLFDRVTADVLLISFHYYIKIIFPLKLILGLHTSEDQTEHSTLQQSFQPEYKSF